jgi:nucleoside-diphosphate-sugar epimerase
MGRRIFLAGAAGAVDRRLFPLLTGAGHLVFGTTRSAARAEELARAGIEPVVVDVFDRTALSRAVLAARPEVVIHQLTDLPPALDPAQMGAAVARNARIREEGTRNLVDAALAAGSDRLIAQSIAWAYAPGPEPHEEGDPLDLRAEGSRSVSIAGVAALEECVLNGPPLAGVVLRYGQLYGPGTGFDKPPGRAPLHVNAAAYAALLSVENGAPGIYNVAEPGTYVSSGKVRGVLGWDAELRLSGDVSAPLHQ